MRRFAWNDEAFELQQQWHASLPPPQLLSFVQDSVEIFLFLLQKVQSVQRCVA